MELALLLVSMAAVVLAATAVSERLRIPAPLLLVVVGAAAAYVPGVPTIHLESEVVLLGLLFVMRRSAEPDVAPPPQAT